MFLRQQMYSLFSKLVIVSLFFYIFCNNIRVRGDKGDPIDKRERLFLPFPLLYCISLTVIICFQNALVISETSPPLNDKRRLCL